MYRILYRFLTSLASGSWRVVNTVLRRDTPRMPSSRTNRNRAASRLWLTPMVDPDRNPTTPRDSYLTGDARNTNLIDAC